MNKPLLAPLQAVEELQQQQAPSRRSNFSVLVLCLLGVMTAATLLLGQRRTARLPVELELTIRQPQRTSNAACGTSQTAPAQKTATTKYQRQLDSWRAFAAEKGCATEDFDYQQIFDDLAPFRAAGGITRAQVWKAFESMPEMGLLEIENGKLTTEERIKMNDAGGNLKLWRQMLEPIAHLLPDTVLALNLIAEPRSWIAPLPAAAEQALAQGNTTVLDAWRQHACDALGQHDLKHQHGFFHSPATMAHQHALLPVFSKYKLPGGCFADILIPHIYDGRFQSACELPETRLPLKDKKQTLLWRGTTTGAAMPNGMKPELYRNFQRQRLVALSNQLKSQGEQRIDAAFTGYLQCGDRVCQQLEEEYGPKATPMNQSELFSHAYLLVVDGNGAADREAVFLCSGSVMFKWTAFQQWFHRWMQPYQHYLPVRADYADLLEKVQWAEEHPEQAQRIASAAATFVKQWLGEAHDQCYWYRLILEYSRLLVN